MLKWLILCEKYSKWMNQHTFSIAFEGLFWGVGSLVICSSAYAQANYGGLVNDPWILSFN